MQKSAVLLALVIVFLLLIAATGVLGLGRIASYRARFKNNVYFARELVSESYPTLKTGDLVLFVSATHSPSNSVFTHTFYTHAGMLLRDGDAVYVSEALPAPARGGGAHGGRGAVLSPLLTRLKYYTGTYYLLRLSRTLDPERSAALKKAAADLAREEYPYPSLPQMGLGLLGFPVPARHCFQHVAYLLDLARLSPAGSVPFSGAGFLGVCRAVCSLDGVTLQGNYHYETPKQLLYDIGAQSA